MAFQPVFPVLLVLAVMHGKLASTACTRNEELVCRDAFVQTAGLSLDNNGIPILFKKGATAGDHATFCTAWNTFKTCNDEFIDDCEENLQYIIQATNQAAEYICTNKTAADYAANHCLGGDANQAFSKVCLSGYSSLSKGDEFCQETNDYLGCLSKGAKTECNQEAANYQFSVVSLLYGHRAAGKNCTLKMADYNCSPSSDFNCYKHFAQMANIEFVGFALIPYPPVPYKVNMTSAELDHMCTSVGSLKKWCDFDNDCSGENKSVTLILDGVEDALDHICANRQEYLDNLDCVGNERFLTEVKTCIPNLFRQHSRDGQCELASSILQQCIDIGTRGPCSEEGNEYQKDIVGRMLKKVQEDSSICGSVGLTSSITIILVALVVTIGQIIA